jgi:hypothetical protein
MFIAALRGGVEGWFKWLGIVSGVIALAILAIFVVYLVNQTSYFLTIHS